MAQRETHSTLKQLGLTTNEARCYLVVVERGLMSVPELAHEAGLDRSNVYRAVSGLVQRGLATMSDNSYGKRVVAASPKKLLSIASEQRRKARRQELQIEGLVPALLQQFNAKGIRPRVQCFEGPEGIIRVFDDSLDEPGVQEILHSTSADFTMFPNVEDYDRSYTDRRSKRGVRIKILTCFNKYSNEWRKRDHLELRETRFVPKEHEFPSSMLIYGNKVSIISHDAEQVAIIVESEELSRMHRALFGYMWENARTHHFKTT